MSPDGFSLRELETMALARLRADWDRAAALIAAAVQARGGKADPAALNPYRQKTAPRLKGAAAVAALKALAGAVRRDPGGRRT